MEPRAPLGIFNIGVSRSEISRENPSVSTDDVAPTVTTYGNIKATITTFVTPHSTTVNNITPLGNSCTNMLESLMTSRNDSYIKSMNENMLQLSHILANPKRSHREIVDDYNEAKYNPEKQSMLVMKTILNFIVN